MAKIYVGTYAKYNNGSIAGAWLDLEDYGDADGFYEACRELHADEADPELMFQDWENIPDGMIGESHLSADVWTWLELSDDDQELLRIYQEEVNGSGDIDEAREAFRGTYDSELDYAWAHWEESGMLDSIPEALRGYVDYESWLRDQRGEIDFSRHNGSVWVFSTNR